MAESAFEIDYDEKEYAGNAKRVLQRYLKYWPWFLMAVLLCLGLGYAYMRYAPTIYESVAKIEIIDESEGIDISSEALSLLGQGSSINMDNEVEILRSYRILRQVVEALDLDVSYYEVGNVKTREIWNPPFAITKLIPEDSLREIHSYGIVFSGDQMTITDDLDNSRVFSSVPSEPGASGYPFDIAMRPDVDRSGIQNIRYKVVLTPMKVAVMNLAKSIRVQPINKNSEILALSLRGESVKRSESILNELIRKFNQDGISDRQAISKRTLDFIDERFSSLSEELDSIEVGKEDFKRVNSLSDLDSDVDFSLQQRAVAQDEVTRLETQVSLAELLKRAVSDQSTYSLLPVDVGLENSGLNSMVAEYNQMAIERERLTTNVGESHPTLVALSTQLQNSRVNIMKTINVYQTQLRLSLRQLNREKNLANSRFSALPEKEKMLRAIERQQSIKENLFMILLQKREEAALNYAVTAPSIKVVDYALTDIEPLSPKKRIVYPLSMMVGMFVPFVILYLRFSMGSKVMDRADLEKMSPSIPVLGEIPTFGKKNSVISAGDRSVLAESIRILGANIGYRSAVGEGEKATSILVTSAVKGEGKTSLALNLALAYAGLNKRVLLVGADLRNPGILKHFRIDSHAYGLSDYLSDPKVDWKDCIVSAKEKSEYLSVCFAGKMPPNPTQLLSGKKFAGFMERAASEFDVVILDSAPCMSVADTLLIAGHADLTLFLVRLGYTDKSLLRYSRDLHQNQQLPNMAYVLNDMGSLKSRKYYS